MKELIYTSLNTLSSFHLKFSYKSIFDSFLKQGTSASSFSNSTAPGSFNSSLAESFSTPRFQGVKFQTMILHCVSKTFNVIPQLFICLGRRIIEYVQSQRNAKTSNMKSFESIVNE